MVDETKIKSVLNNFKPKTSCGDDGISMKLLKVISDSIISPLAILVNQSLLTGVFPHNNKLL